MDLVTEATRDIQERIFPFWAGLLDEKHGGFIGKVNFDLKRKETAHKGVILNSRILYFFSEYARTFQDPKAVLCAQQAYRFMSECCFDPVKGGLYWSLDYQGNVFDSTKHGYNQAFGIYALSSYYALSQDREALTKALGLYRLLETTYRAKDAPHYYQEAMDRDFQPLANDKLSENGVSASRTMNTALHLLEAYTALARVSEDGEVKHSLEDLLRLFRDKIYNPRQNRLEVFFDPAYHSLLDLDSYGHDIEAAWLLSEATAFTDDISLKQEIAAISEALVLHVMKEGYRPPFVVKEKEKGRTDGARVWWVQAEAINGLLSLYGESQNEELKKEAEAIYQGIEDYFHDKRDGGCWYWDLNAHNLPRSKKCIVEPWKCPYHNGRMCLEIIKSLSV